MALIRSTSERRAGVLKLKLMFDEAHRLREEGNIEAYANQIAEINLTYFKLNPEHADKIPLIEEYAAFTRSQGKAPDYSKANWRKDNFAYLDERLQSAAYILRSFEKQLRIGFDAEMTCAPGRAKFI
jgi:hypothetical protein